MKDLSFLWDDKPEYTNLILLITSLLMNSYSIWVVNCLASYKSQYDVISKKTDGQFEKPIMDFFRRLDLPWLFWKDVLMRLLAKYLKDGYCTGCDMQLLACALIMADTHDDGRIFLEHLCREFKPYAHMSRAFYMGLELLLEDAGKHLFDEPPLSAR